MQNLVNKFMFLLKVQLHREEIKLICSATAFHNLKTDSFAI